MRDDQLLQWLHGGMFETPMWERFLSCLLVNTDAAIVTLAFRFADEGHAVLRLAQAAGTARLPDSGLERAMFANEHQRSGRVYDLGELMEFMAPDARANARGWLDSQSITRWRGVLVSGDDAPDVWLSCGGGTAIDAGTGALLMMLAPHLTIAMRSLEALQRARLRTAIADAAFSRLRAGWFALDARCRIIDQSDTMAEMLRWDGPLRCGRYGRLIPASPEIDRRLTTLVRHLSEGRDVRPQAFCLCDDPWIDMLVTAASGAALVGARPATAIAYVRGDRHSHTDRCEQLEQLFGLLPSEARLAWQLAQAIPIADAAGALCLTVETARNYSKKIYAKTGARGQADLVRIITTSVLALH